jgi:hypothetical protein
VTFSPNSSRSLALVAENTFTPVNIATSLHPGVCTHLSHLLLTLSKIHNTYLSTGRGTPRRTTRE